MAEVDVPCECASQNGSKEEKLLSAAKKGHIRCVQNLVTDEKHTEKRTFHLESVTLDLTQEGDVDALECLLKAASAENVQIHNVHDVKFIMTTPLGIAAEKRDAEIVALLLKYGACVNSGDETPIFYAVHSGSYVVAKMLLEAGAKIRCNSEVCPLVMAALDGNFDLCKLLLQFGANVNESSILNTPLIIAVQRRNLEAVRMLVRYRADVDFRGSEGTALEYLYWRTLNFTTSDHNYFLILKELLYAADVRDNPYALSTAISFVEKGKCEDIKVKHLPLLYAAGCQVTVGRKMSDIESYKTVIPQFILDDQNISKRAILVVIFSIFQFTKVNFCKLNSKF